MITGADCAALDFDICYQEYRFHQKRASGQTLTESAVTNRRSFRVAEGSIPDVTAKAATLMDSRHVFPQVVRMRALNSLECRVEFPLRVL